MGSLASVVASSRNSRATGKADESRTSMRRVERETSAAPFNKETVMS